VNTSAKTLLQLEQTMHPGVILASGCCYLYRHEK